MDCSPPGSSVHGIFQARILEWCAISFSRGSSQPRDQTQVLCTAGRSFTNWATREAWEKLRDWPKKAEHERTDAFKLCCWRRLLRVPWTARRLSQSILKEINPTYSLEGQEYSGHLLGRADSLEKTLMLGKIEDRRRRGWQRIRWLYDITDSMDVSFSKLKTGKPGMPQSMGLKESDMTEQLTKKSVKAGPTTQVCRHQAPPSFCGRSNHDYRIRELHLWMVQGLKWSLKMPTYR